jgi:pilus assembly protein CpaE
MDDTKLQVLVALADDVNRYAIERTLGDAVEVIDYSDGLGEEWHMFLDQASDLVIVACHEFGEETAHVVDRAVKQRPERPVVVLTEQTPNGSLRPAFEAGADDVLALPLSSTEAQFAIEKVIARRRGSAHMAGIPTAPLICVLGPKGGTGKTLVSANLAVELAQRGKRVVLVDLDLQFGDIGLSLGLVPTRTIFDLVKAGAPYDHDKLDRHLMRHSSGVKVLVAPTRPDQANAVTVEFLRDVYASLRTMCDIVIVDTPPGFTPEVIATIDVSSASAIVGMLDSLSLKNTKLGLETLDLMGYPMENVSLILNRADSRVGITHDDVSSIIGRVPDVLVPSDRDIPRSVNAGEPIVSSRDRSDAARAFQQLADLYAKASLENRPRDVETSRRPTLLRRR